MKREQTGELQSLMN